MNKDLSPTFSYKTLAMCLLVIANFIACVYLPDIKGAILSNGYFSSGHHFGFLLPPIIVPAFFFYLLLAAFGIYALMHTVFDLIVKRPVQKSRIAAVYVLALSILIVCWVTFFPHQYKYKEEGYFNSDILIKYNRHWFYRENCIWHGDTIVCRNEGTIVVYEAEHTLHWTYKPGIHYRYDYFHKEGNFQDPPYVTFCPGEYYANMQYVINCVDHHPTNDFYYEPRAVSDVYENDTTLLFVFKELDKIGYLWFEVRNHTAVFKDSCRDIRRLHPHPDAVKWPGFKYFLKTSNGIPLIVVEYKLSDSMMYSEDNQYLMGQFDIERKQFALVDMKE